MTYPCGNCRDTVPHTDLLYRVDWLESLVCGACKHDKEVDAARAVQEAEAAQRAVAVEGTWESEQGLFLKAQRNAKLEASRWAIDRDSPLSDDNQEEWIAYRALLNRMTVDHTIDSWVWPDVPEQRYA